MKDRLTGSLYVLDLALWVGGISIFTFIATPAIFRSFDRDMAGRVVGAMFTGYFYYTFALTALALALVFFVWRDRASTLFRASLLLAVLAVGMSGYVAFNLYPEIRAVKAQIASFETTPRESPERKRFGRMHAVSAVLNLLLLADGAALLLIRTSRRE
ncbi:MAG: DUF4149 domain-containing protein [Nitrospirae bacterium]|nr:DUF4149 domain-containing protein [Nitrospirota bacterium]